MHSAFTPPTPSYLPLHPSRPLLTHPRSSPTLFRSTTPKAQLSVPFPLPDSFAYPTVAFPTSLSPSDYRPELLGSILFSVGLYLGFSETTRWGSLLRTNLTSLLSTTFPPALADTVATATHTLPFLLAGFFTDAVLRYLAAGNAVWAIALGLSAALYGGVYELGRLSATGKQVAEGETKQYGVFADFAERRLVEKTRGMCHLVDIRSAIRDDPAASSLQYASDETLRRYMRNLFPRAIRSPNGFYRGVCVRAESDGRRAASWDGVGEEIR